jgi:microcystin-dependent protein
MVASALYLEPGAPPATDREAWRKLASTVNALLTSAGQGLPPGIVQPFAGNNVPLGWLLCDGREYSIAEYPPLFAALGTLYGGDGQSTFAVPDYTGRTLFGATAQKPVASRFGADAVQLTVGNLPPHDHALVDPGHTHVFAGTPHSHTLIDPGHTHTIPAGDTEGVGVAQVATTATGSIASSSAVTGISVQATTAGGSNAPSMTGIQIGSTGRAEPVPTIPPGISVLYVIKV